VRAGIPQLHEDYVSRLAPAVWWENVERIPTLAAGAWSYMREPADWLLLHTFPLQLLLAAEITRSAGWLPWLRPAANAAGDAYRVGPTASEA
jgi:hypothetical protein